jgi:hypothetical protein
MAQKTDPGKSYACRVCGYRVVVDEACGCAEEHVLLCCGQPMKVEAAKKPARRPAARKAAKKSAKKR